MPDILEVNLSRPLTGNMIAERLRRYVNAFEKASLSISPYREVIQWHNDPNLDGLEPADYDSALAVMLRIYFDVPFPGFVNDLLPPLVKRPQHAVSRFGLWIPRDYRKLYLHTRIGTSQGTEEYVYPNSVLVKRFYPPIEQFMNSSLG